MSTPTSSLSSKVVSVERLHVPNSRGDIKHTPLSILDATVADFSPARVIFFFEAIPGQNGAFSIEVLKSSLQAILVLYPQWCGRLHFNDFVPGSTSHTDRYGRFVLSYGDDQDPGIEFVVARTAVALSSLIPSAEKRADSLQAWDATDLPRDEFCPATVLAPYSEDSDAPAAIVQVTQFSCGGCAVDLKVPHILADGTSFSRFVSGWAAIARGESIATVPAPIFDPQMLDQSAAGNIDSNQPDLAIIRRARQLPCHRYDWWISGADCPFPTTSTKIPESLRNLGHDDSGLRIPWSEVDVTAPMKMLVLHFTGLEISEMQKSAAKIDPRVSKQDALVAHIWSCINRARGAGSNDEPVYLNCALGVRNRISPSLGDGFVGSPILLASTTATAREASQDDGLAVLAAKLRKTIASFTPDAIAAYIHDRIYDQCPQRLWQTFIGKRHVLTTSLVHSGLSKIDFGFGTPRYAESVMPKFDGLVGLLEARPKGNGREKRDWSSAGVDCQIHLPVTIAKELLQDPILRRFAEQPMPNEN